MKPNWRTCGVAECYRDHACHRELSGRTCLVKERQEAFAYEISNRVQYDEIRAQRALGADWVTAYTAAWAIMDEVHALVLSTERPAVHLPARWISRANAGTPI